MLYEYKIGRAKFKISMTM